MSSSKQRKRKRIIFYLVCLVFLLIFILLIVLLIRAIKNAKASSPEESNTSIIAEGSSRESSSAPEGIEIITSDGVTEEMLLALSQKDAPEGFHVEIMEEAMIHQGTQQLVNKVVEYTFQDDWLVNLADQDRYGYGIQEWDIQVAAPMAEPLNEFLNQFYENTLSFDLYVMNGYRTKEGADQLFQQDVDAYGYDYANRYTMQAGHSEHHTGLAFDLGMYSGVYFNADYDQANNWIYDHAAEYGFILRYPADKEPITQISYESWHFRYVGVPVATAITTLDMCFEEWCEFIKNYKADAPFEVSCADGVYGIYYAEGLAVPVPEEGEYEISGNNMDGFVVVMKLSD